jgi:hypothetical protein
MSDSGMEDSLHCSESIVEFGRKLYEARRLKEDETQQKK